MSKRMTVQVRGLTFESVPACAKYFGVHRDRVYSALAKGRADSLGLGVGNYVRTKPPAPRGKPVVLATGTFRSMSEASRDLGMNRDYIIQKVKRKGAEGWREIRELALRVAMERASHSAMLAARGGDHE